MGDVQLLLGNQERALLGAPPSALLRLPYSGGSLFFWREKTCCQITVTDRILTFTLVEGSEAPQGKLVGDEVAAAHGSPA